MGVLAAAAALGPDGRVPGLAEQAGHPVYAVQHRETSYRSTSCSFQPPGRGVERTVFVADRELRVGAEETDVGHRLVGVLDLGVYLGQHNQRPG